MEGHPMLIDQQINIVKMVRLQKEIYVFDAVSTIKLPMAFLHRDRKSNLKVHIEKQKTSNSQSNLELKEKLMYPDA
jgi:hypothetical protein